MTVTLYLVWREHLTVTDRGLLTATLYLVWREHLIVTERKLLTDSVLGLEGVLDCTERELPTVSQYWNKCLTVTEKEVFSHTSLVLG